MMRNKKPVLCATTSLVKVLTETLWQKVSFSEGWNFIYLGARNSVEDFLVAKNLL